MYLLSTLRGDCCVSVNVFLFKFTCKCVNTRIKYKFLIQAWYIYTGSLSALYPVKVVIHLSVFIHL